MSERCRPPQIPEKFSTIEELSDFLEQWGVSVEEWGEGNAKKVEHLFEELEKGESKLELKRGELLRSLRAVNIRVYYLKFKAPEEVTLFYLQEIKQVFKIDERERRRSFPWSVSDKLFSGEMVIAGAIRALDEELNISPDRGFIPGKTEEKYRTLREFSRFKDLLSK